jgi:hypothetical protein
MSLNSSRRNCNLDNGFGIGELLGTRYPLKTLLGSYRKIVSSVPLPVTNVEGLGSFRVG